MYVMPAVAVHYYFGQEVLRRLDEKITAAVIEHKQCFDLGLQGPDLLFYYKPFQRNEINGLGIAMHHEKASVPVQKAAESIRLTSDSMALSYLLGFVCHFVLDSSLHGKISRIAPTHAAHFYLEAEMDRHIIKLHYHIRPQQFRRSMFVRLDVKSYDWLRAMYPTVPVEKLEKACDSMVFYLNLLRTSGPLKQRLLVFLEKMLRIEGAFTSMIIGPQPYEDYSENAKKLCAEINKVVSVGVDAVKNCFACVTDNAALSPLFEKDFE